MSTAYPLSWPEGVPRQSRREKGAFKTTLAGALKNVTDSLRKFGVDSKCAVSNVVLSSNCTLGVNRPDDPGVAVWFNWDGQQRCIPIDRYTTPEANLQAIHHIIEARRVELRHGTLVLVRATFKGFLALPPAKGKKTWREVMGVNDGQVTIDYVKRKYRELASQRHPDKGGSHEAMTELNEALAEAESEVAA